MIISLFIKLAAGRCAQDDWSCELEVAESMTLDDLHYAIQNVVAFDNDHLYAYFIARKVFGSKRAMIDDEDELENTSIAALFPLPKDRKLFYWFDFGDDWMFQISRSRKKPREPLPGRHYPFIVSESGNKPEQYPGDEEW
ncbi:hypothetical protein Q9290_03350 [Oceanimonas sp. CHS3-5]|uniref:IS1096 element passenger TnpR family protein n=1 Tax=Oceanimonas sp. CHS3-5 TaxID=3068186 RepID=UPI00273EAE89|nr:hypothetical protein [Oceanimonas sp. CHS3-5]MDP5291331.1 hypothetical protein [Oceanimonas sp. CHS3-5]